MAEQDRAAGSAVDGAAVPPHTTHMTRRGRPFDVLETLPRLAPEAATAMVVLPSHVYWSGSGVKVWDLGDRATRIEAYRTLLREGRADDIARYVDRDLLVDAWADMFLPDEIRAAWQPLINTATIDTAEGRGER